MDHPIAHPRNAVILGIMFMVDAAVYLWLSHDASGATLLAVLGIGMMLAAYVLASGSPRG